MDSKTIIDVLDILVGKTTPVGDSAIDGERWNCSMKIPKFVTTVCCQGQPFYYYSYSLIGAIACFITQYKTKKKYGTMRFSLNELYETDNAYKVWNKRNKNG